MDLCAHTHDRLRQEVPPRQHQEVAFLLQQIYGVTPHSDRKWHFPNDGGWSSDSLRNPARDYVEMDMSIRRMSAGFSREQPVESKKEGMKDQNVH